MTITLNPEALRSAFAAERFSFDDKEVQFATAEAGLLTVSSGRVAAGDPLADPALEPFTQCVPNGEYPVTLATARFDGGEERLAFARVQFEDKPVANWYPALTPNQDARELQWGQHFGFTSASGEACFMDGPSAMVRFACGAGGAEYPSYFGYDSNCRVVALVTDFHVVPPLRIALPVRRSWWQKLLDFFNRSAHSEGGRTQVAAQRQD